MYVLMFFFGRRIMKILDRSRFVVFWDGSHPLCEALIKPNDPKLAADGWQR